MKPVLKRSAVEVDAEAIVVASEVVVAAVVAVIVVVVAAVVVVVDGAVPGEVVMVVVVVAVVVGDSEWSSVSCQRVPKSFYKLTLKLVSCELNSKHTIKGQDLVPAPAVNPH
jgi:hypothetical protein